MDQSISKLYFRTGLPTRAIQRLARQYDCGAILGVYSDVHALVVARRASAALGLPLSIYLHDPIVEGMQGGRIFSYAKKVQAAIFSPKYFFFSMSEGLAELLLSKYGLRAIPLPHCYNETPSPPLMVPRKAGSRTALFSGSIYDINRPSVVRAAKAAIRAGYRIVCTSPGAADTIIADGVPAASVEVKSLPSRGEYLALLQEQDVLFVALSWPDESPIHRDSLATTFPTKIPEYLGAGRPILIHCPDDYFLAAFVRKHQCGLVISDRSEEALFNAWSALRDDANLALRLARNGHQAVAYFDGRRIAAIFKQHIEMLVARGYSNPSLDSFSPD